MLMKKNYDITWDQIELSPSVQLKFGIKRRTLPLTGQYTQKRSQLYYVNQYVELKGKWDNSPGFGSLLSLKLKNIHKKSIRIARLVFPAENGLDDFLTGYNPADISFLRNGYQSWSTARSYRVTEKPLRSWLKYVKLASSNMANLPSNTPGNLSSEMFSVITDIKKNRSFFVGQVHPFNQFFYIRLVLHTGRTKKKSHFELVYDFGRKIINAGETIQLDGIIMGLGDTVELQRQYFSFIKSKSNIKIPKENIKGWSTWYYYYSKISPRIIYDNLKTFKEKALNFDFVQIDDGYQTNVGDWLCLKPAFKGRMHELAEAIKSAGYKPGIWVAPFIASIQSELARNHPDFILRTEYGKPIIAGYCPDWHGNFFYALDITNPRVEEYITDVIKTIIHKWGYQYLKLDFLFGGCMRGGNHNKAYLSRAEVLNHGLKIIREAAGKEVTIVGCGMPLSQGIGNVHAMRVGPDTAPTWKRIFGFFFQTGAMIGARNSIRNFQVRSFMHKKLWLNDPDCLMVRNFNTHLNEHERMTQINAIILSGGLLMFSDDFSQLDQELMDQILKIIELNELCYKGEALPLDVMEREMPEIYYNTAGYIGFFNFRNKTRTLKIDLNKYTQFLGRLRQLTDVWTGENMPVPEDQCLRFVNMPAHASRLFLCHS